MEGGITLTTALTVEPVFAKLDHTLIQRAVGNLIANAVAHTPPGGAVVLRANSDTTTIRIEVSDTGKGISHDALPKVFDRFYRVDKSQSQALVSTSDCRLCRASLCSTAAKWRLLVNQAMARA